MSIVSALKAAAATATTPTDAAGATVKTDADKNALDYNAFLQLLVAQMKNQDPLNPSDPTQQLSQLASFSNVEQSIKVNDKLTTLLVNSSLDQASSVIGKTVTTADGKTTGTVKSVAIYDDGAVATLASGAQVLLGSGLKIE
jgi:flagellar basal-body rod modification protein FlgD